MFEGAATDAELNARESRRTGLEFEWRRGEGRDELLSAFTVKEPGKGTGLGLDM
jgi:hypothetical protein